MIELLENNAENIVSENIEKFEQLSGRRLYPGQPEWLIIQCLSYRETLIRGQIQHVGEQMLVEYSTGLALDQLGKLVGVERLAPQPSKTTIKFISVGIHPEIYIPEGTFVSSNNGQAVFKTTSSLFFSVNDTEMMVEAVNINIGVSGNGYQAGSVTTINTPITYIVSASNINTTNGGSSIESDESLRKRIILAPNRYSTAGSVEAYRYWAFTANANIIDVSVLSPSPGHVNIYPLTVDGSVTPIEILNAVNSICNGQKVRPLTDTVNVMAPERINYTLVVNVVLLINSDQDTVLIKIKSNVAAYVKERRSKLGLDIIDDKIIHETTIDGVYSVDLVGFNNIVLSKSQYAYCTEYIVNVIGLNEG